MVHPDLKLVVFRCRHSVFHIWMSGKNRWCWCEGEPQTAEPHGPHESMYACISEIRAGS